MPGTHAFRVWGYGTTDPLEQVLAPDYFALARTLLRAGELIYVNLRPRQRRGSEAEAGEPRMALVMARAAEGDAEAAGGSVRLVQDFGRPQDCPGAAGDPGSTAAAPPAPVKRGRGRPPGSRNKKPAPLTPAAGG